MEAEQKAQQTMRIKAIATVAAVVLLVIIAALTWNEKGGYTIEIPTDEGQTWSCAVIDDFLIRQTDSSYENGDWCFTFEAVKAGETQIALERTADENPSKVLEERTYNIQIFDDMTVMQMSVNREMKE